MGDEFVGRTPSKLESGMLSPGSVRPQPGRWAGRNAARRSAAPALGNSGGPPARPTLQKTPPAIRLQSWTSSTAGLSTVRDSCARRYGLNVIRPATTPAAMSSRVLPSFRARSFIRSSAWYNAQHACRATISCACQTRGLGKLDAARSPMSTNVPGCGIGYTGQPVR